MAQFLVSFNFFAKGKSNMFITLFCPFSVFVKKVIFMEAGHRLSVESGAFYLKSGSIATENSLYVRKVWCLLCKDSVMSLSKMSSNVQIKMSFTQTTKICRKMLAI